MQVRGVNELRRMFLEYFEKNGHLRMKSFSLVPHNDNSLLLINSGMAPLKPYFTGQEIPPRRRVTTCQKCIRTGDIDNVGKTARHGTFFEMLGNFSFGDYFKKEAIPFAWNFLTQEVGLDPARLYPSVFSGNETTPADDEAYEIWNKVIGVPADHIYKFGKEDNFWEHGEGPCGPCTEIYYDRGEKWGNGPEDVMGGEGDRFVEVWNVVFSQFDNDGKGHYTELIQKNIDTGMGLERLAMVVQDEESIYTVDTNKAILDYIAELCGVVYHSDHEKDISLRILTDHTKSSTFMISDGIMPSNEGRGYVLRRIIRRAVRHGRKLGIKGVFMPEMAKRVIELNKDGYPELEEKSVMILKVLKEEEEKFNKTIDTGMNILNDMIKDMEENGEKVLSGQNSFKLYDTYGFPIDLTEEILLEKGLEVDRDSFNAFMKQQKEMARNARKHSNYMGADATVYDEIDPHITSVFTGYENEEDTGKVLVLTTETEIVEALTEGDKGTIITDKTPFYATMGGQAGDSGIIFSNDGEFKVEETINLKGGRVGHVGVMVKGMISEGSIVTLKIDKVQRGNTAKNHSATHLLQKALRTVLGEHVEQAGAYYDKDRLRFDFTHFQAMTAEELKKVEELVNEAVNLKSVVDTKEMSIDDAKKTGAMALFGEKYGEKVRVVTMGDSIELCGGTHVKNTSDIGSFRIISEAGIAAGVRRIEALTGNNLLNYYKEKEDELTEAAALLKCKASELSDRIKALLEESKKLKSENESLKAKAAGNSLGNAADDALDVNGVKVVAVKVEASDINAMRTLTDSLKEKLKDAVIVLASVIDGKVMLVASASDSAVKKGASAGSIIKEIAPVVGGRGGGKPQMAQAGGTDAGNIEAALEKAKEIAKSQIK
ncbi:MAG: alanine--tRNA ligase [Lachnospiraceae bacterium]|nr:alanine--tRNA ligase [Lachnospiraceae bacterium]